MSNVVNLNKFRKAKVKDGKGKKAAENRRKHGRTKSEKAAEKAGADRDAAAHEGRDLRDPDSNPDDQEPA